MIEKKVESSLAERSPAKYFPYQNGVYEVVPGLCAFGNDFGNGTADQKTFQLDREYFRYRENKIQCRIEGIGKYYVTSEYSSEVAQKIEKFILEKLHEEEAPFFQWHKRKNGKGELFCTLTQEHLVFDADAQLILQEGGDTQKYPYGSSLDALANQVQEDFAVWQIAAKSQKNWLSALHLCAPNHWSPAEKIGQNFRAVHVPVADNEKILKPAKALVAAMVHKGPYVRFVWGLATDCRLNHHPLPPSQENPVNWLGRQFDPSHPQLYLRMERQTLHGFPAVGAALFTIRTYFQDCEEIKKEPILCSSLISAIQSMSKAAQQYKGVQNSYEVILAWLKLMTSV